MADKPLTKQDIEEIIRNGSKAPSTWQELIWRASREFGLPVAAFGVLLLVFYQTFPDWVKANINTQERLSKNLDIQTQNLEAQTEVLDEMITDHKEFGKDHAVQAEAQQAMVDTLKSIHDELKRP